VSHICKCFITYMYKSCHRYIWVMSLVTPRHRPRTEYTHFWKYLRQLASASPEVPCNTLQHTARHWHNTLQHTATHCNTMQHTAARQRFARSAMPAMRRAMSGDYCIPLQHTATHCNTLQYPTTPCNTMQHLAARCTTPQHPATRSKK